MSQTIVAIATPLGRSGIGVIRLSGETSLYIAQKLTRNENLTPKPRFATLQNLFDPDNAELIDQVLITYFKSPQSFTGEDVVEISCHGSPVLIRQIIDFCLRLDARLAKPGEFSLRALSNGQINLSQAEAIRDLIDAQSIAFARQAVRQLHGELSTQLQTLKDDLLNIIVVFESSIEFVEDDLPDLQVELIKKNLSKTISEIDKLASTFRAGNLLRQGIKVVLVGRPNVGKSSIFNYLVGHDRAIVTEIAGTTRDSISETLTINGIPVLLIDTAGLRETSEMIESIGVSRARQLMADADLVLAVLDNSQDLTDEDRKIFSDISSLNILVAINKVDLNDSDLDLSEFKNSRNVVKISAYNGYGFDELRNSIVQQFLPQDFNDSGILISDSRHFDLLVRSKDQLKQSLVALDSKLNEEIVLVYLHNAMKLLGEITGETTTEDVLSRVFSTFCIGK